MPNHRVRASCVSDGAGNLLSDLVAPRTRAGTHRSDHGAGHSAKVAGHRVHGGGDHARGNATPSSMDCRDGSCSAACHEHGRAIRSPDGARIGGICRDDGISFGRSIGVPPARTCDHASVHLTRLLQHAAWCKRVTRSGVVRATVAAEAVREAGAAQQP